MNLFLQIFLYIDIFIIGVVATLVYRHARAHFETKKAPPKPVTSNNALPHEMREKLLSAAEEKFNRIINHSADQFDQELKATTDRVNNTVAKLTGEIAAKEMEKIEAMFKQQQQQAADELSKTKGENEQLKSELKAKMAEDVEQERQRLVALIDANLSNALTSFLTEAMQHEVDLGSQESYLLSLLDAHKEELKQAVKNET